MYVGQLLKIYNHSFWAFIHLVWINFFSVHVLLMPLILFDFIIIALMYLTNYAYSHRYYFTHWWCFGCYTKKIIYQFASTHKFAYCFSIDPMRCGDLLYPIQFTTCILRKQCRAMWPRYSRSPLTILTNLQSKYVRIYGVTSVVGIRKNKVLSLIFPTARFTRSISPLQERSFVCCML